MLRTSLLAMTQGCLKIACVRTLQVRDILIINLAKVGQPADNTHLMHAWQRIRLHSARPSTTARARKVRKICARDTQGGATGADGILLGKHRQHSTTKLMMPPSSGRNLARTSRKEIPDASDAFY